MDIRAWFERISSYPVHVLFVLILVVAFVVRLLLGFLFTLQFGTHAVPYAETYFFYGVMEGSFSLTARDPTQALFALTRGLLPPSMLYPALIVWGALLSSLTASCLFLLARTLSGSRMGVVCALLYAFMAEPLTMGILLFTHDLVQLPFFTLSLLFGVRAMRERRMGPRAVSLVLMAASLACGWAVNAVIVVALEVILLFFLFSLAGRLSARAGIGRDVQASLAVGLMLLLVLLRVSGIVSVPSLLRFVSSLFPAYPYEGLLATFLAGSPDINPISLGALWTRYNVLLLFLPFSFYLAFRRKDYFSILFLVVTLFTASLMDRGTRLLDLSVALLVPHAFFFWERPFTRHAYLLFFCAACILLVFIIIVPPSALVMATLFSPLLLFAGFLFYERRWDAMRLGHAFLAAFMLLSIPATYLTIIAVPPQIAQAEWLAASAIPPGHETLLVPWAQGFFFQAASGHPVQASPSSPDYSYYRILMMGEEEAYGALAEEKIHYVIISDREFRIYVNPTTHRLSRKVHDYFKPYLADDARLKDTLAYRMLYESATLTRFRLVFEERDEAAGIVVKVFVVEGGEA